MLSSGLVFGEDFYVLLDFPFDMDETLEPLPGDFLLNMFEQIPTNPDVVVWETSKQLVLQFFDQGLLPPVTFDYTPISGDKIKMLSGEIYGEIVGKSVIVV